MPQKHPDFNWRQYMPDQPTKRDDAMTPTDPAESPSYYPARKGITIPASKAVKSSPWDAVEQQGRRPSKEPQPIYDYTHPQGIYPDGLNQIF